VHPGHKTRSHYFSFFGGDRYGLDKKHTGTRYVEHVFLHLVRSVGYVMYFGRSRVQNIDALFFMLGWDWYGFDKRRAGTCYVELMSLHAVESVGYVVHSSGSR
jgi:hypothetical protein